MHTVTRFFSACIIIILLLFGATWWYNNHQIAGITTEVKATSDAKGAASSIPTIDEAALSTAINSILGSKKTLDASVSITDLQTGKTYHYGDDAAYTAASVGKLVTTAAYLHKVELGQLQMTGTEKTYIQKMLVNSDNEAWHNLEAILTLDVQQAYGTEIGMTSYHAEDNIMTSDDISVLLTKLARYRLLNNADTDMVLGYLNQANYRNYIVAAVPSGVEVYHKVGFLSDRLHDVAIIKKGDRSYVLSIFSKSSGTYDFSAGSTYFKNITDATLKVFFGINQ
jgi:beta-lactamase class A